MATLTPFQHERKTRLRQAQNGARRENAGQQTGGGANAQSAPDRAKVSTAQWLLMFSAAGLAWLGGLLLDLMIPAVTLLVNYLAVLGIWMWAKMRGLQPPTFASAMRGAAVPGAASAQAALPRSDMAYVLLGGITPILYLAALWWNNRS